MGGVESIEKRGAASSERFLSVADRTVPARRSSEAGFSIENISRRSLILRRRRARDETTAGVVKEKWACRELKSGVFAGYCRRIRFVRVTINLRLDELNTESSYRVHLELLRPREYTGDWRRRTIKVLARVTRTLIRLTSSHTWWRME